MIGAKKKNNALFYSSVAADALGIIAIILSLEDRIFEYDFNYFSMDTGEFIFYIIADILHVISYCVPPILLTLYIRKVYYKNENPSKLIPQTLIFLSLRLVSVWVGDIAVGGFSALFSGLMLQAPIMALLILSIINLSKGKTFKSVILIIPLALFLIAGVYDLLGMVEMFEDGFYTVAYVISVGLGGVSVAIVSAILWYLATKERCSFMNLKVENVNFNEMTARDALLTLKLFYDDKQLTEEEYNEKRKEIIAKI